MACDTTNRNRRQMWSGNKIYPKGIDLCACDCMRVKNLQNQNVGLKPVKQVMEQNENQFVGWEL